MSRFEWMNPDPLGTWFTSDTHFGHHNILGYCGRPFPGVEEMDEAIIANWNRVVPQGGIVYHLGDFAIGGFQAVRRYREALNGRIVLIRGNHDFKDNQQNEDQLRGIFDLVVPSLQVSIGGKKVHLSHFPYFRFSGSGSGAINLFGHVHSGPHTKTPEFPYPYPGQQYDVGVDNNNFTPVSWGELLSSNYLINV